MLALIFISKIATAQVCTGSLGDPVVNIDFGKGFDQFGPILSSTSYSYVRDSPQDGSYTVANSTLGMNPGWYTVFNHTPNASNGYMMVVNADEEPNKIFYESGTPIDLCPNTTYEFAAWVINILISLGGNKPNLTFFILSMDDKVLGSYNTGDIPNGNPIWKQYGFLFKTTAAGRVKIRMVNNGPGGGGNDIALDDITFRACGPRITAGVNNGTDFTANICERSNAAIRLSAEVEGSPTLRYQWQQYNGSTWLDVPGETSTSTDVQFNNAQLGEYRYRLAVAEASNFNSPLCRTLSPTLTVRVNPYPVPQALSNGPVCLGDALILDVANADGTYEWRDPAGTIISTQKSPVIPNATYAMAGTYTVKVNSFGCETSNTVDVAVIAPPVPAVGNPEPEICEETSVQLSASGGTYYSWSPAEGLSNTEIANPIASPLVTTRYTVKVMSGSCFRTAEVNVIVNKTPRSDAGPDKKVLLGYNTKLDGKASGDEIDFFWTPSAGVDDPRSLHPVVTPTQSTTYTLNVVSRLGCVTAVDEVFVKVYEKLIVPNVFSPNGDGTNDLWNITAIDAFDTPDVKVMNRYGELVFESSGYTSAWDGKHKNNDLPVGVYYYVIRLRNDIKAVSGSVTIIR